MTYHFETVHDDPEDPEATSGRDTVISGSPARERAQDCEQSKGDPVAQCEQMIRLLDAQLVDLDAFRAQVIDARKKWSGQLQRLQQGQGASIKAPHGSIKTLVVEVLRTAPGGLTADETFKSLVENHPTANRRSVRQVLERLRESGKVSKFGARWCLQSEVRQI